MRSTSPLVLCLLVSVSTTSASAQDLPVWFDGTAVHLPDEFNDPAIGTDDDSQKAFAWGDVDQDGDADLVCVRKQPFSAPGGRRNVLFMNEGMAEGHATNGVLVDRTALYGVASDVRDDQGLLAATPDSDVVLIDVTGDGRLDIVIASAFAPDGVDKHLTHPRVYVNLGDDGGGWLGFRYEDARIPLLHPTVAPRFQTVAAGDLTGDGAADLFFFDVDAGGEIPRCSRATFFWRNLGGHPLVTFDPFATGLPTDELHGVHDAAVFDIDGDGWRDIVLGRCTGTRILISDPPVGIDVVFDGDPPAIISLSTSRS